VEKVRGEHGRSLGVQELPPCRVSAPLRCRQDPQGLEDPADRGRTDPVTEFSSSPWIRWYPQPWFSVASRPISAAISALTGGRPVRFG
jgi:hypothetical protein